MFLSLHTVFILNENIKWLEEFLIYYINLGFEHFYLYDNEGTTGGDGCKTNSKYGFPITTTSRQEDRDTFNKILLKYGNYISHILWIPKNSEGQIIYGQTDSIKDCILNYGHLNEWIAFVDFDEFIFSEKNINLIEYLNSLHENISNVKLIQKKFLDRFLTKETFITQEFKCINNLEIGTDWAPKNIVRCRDFLSLENIHVIYTKKETIVPPTNILRFNHYNLNNKQLEWMKWYYNKNEFKIDGVDHGMCRYKDLFIIDN
jgi:hypothetical protein